LFIFKNEYLKDVNVSTVRQLPVSQLSNFLLCLDLLPKTPSKAGQRPMTKRELEQLDHRSGVDFFTQLDKIDDKGR